MTDEVLTIMEVAALLKPAEEPICGMASMAEGAAFKIRWHWRVRRAELEEWLDSRPRGSANKTRKDTKD